MLYEQVPNLAQAAGKFFGFFDTPRRTPPICRVAATLTRLASFEVSLFVTGWPGRRHSWGLRPSGCDPSHP